MPAILGLYRTEEVVSDLQKMIGVPLFEIPTIPPSVPGLRLKEAFERGLHADRIRIKEAIFDLPVYQPGNRAEWHRRDFLDARGHLVNRAGVEVDDSFRPLNRSRQPAFRTLFAAGSLLAHNDWKRLKCSAGVAIASAFGAVKSFIRLCQ